MSDFDFQPGTSPLLISVPHAGTALPPDLAERLTREARALPDTDWRVDGLWDFAPSLGAGLIVARWSRYLVDLNRPPDDAPLYASPTTGLVPVTTFDGKPLYPGDPPDRDEVRARLQRYWRPYHDAVDKELRRLREAHGHAVLLDAHSIRSVAPALFDGRLPALNLGTNDGASAGSTLAKAAWAALSSDSHFDAVQDDRFKGGYITRHFGRPAQGLHALQLEMAQRCYMRERPPAPDAARQARVTPLLRRVVMALRDGAPT